MYIKRYRLKRKYKNFIIFYMIICILFFTNYTFSRYITTTSNSAVATIAKFNVKVNSIDITDGQEFEFNLSPNTNTYDNKLAPNLNGYFEIEIDPTDTEVSIEYEFKFNLEELNENIKITEAVINDTETIQAENNIIKGEINLKDNSHGFTSQDIKKIKIYWDWNGDVDIINPEIKKGNITVTSIVKQKIS